MKHFVPTLILPVYCISKLVSVSDNSLHIFPIFLAKYREMKLGSRLLHSTVHVLNVDKKEQH